MTDQDFLNNAEKVLLNIETTCDKINDQGDVDIDNSRQGNAITLLFSNGSQIIINLQKPVQEIWLAAQAGGYHFHFTEEGNWQEAREGREFYSTLSEFATQQAGVSVLFCALS